MARAAERSDEPGECVTAWPLVSGGVGEFSLEPVDDNSIGTASLPMRASWHGRRPSSVCGLRLVVLVDLAEGRQLPRPERPPGRGQQQPWWLSQIRLLKRGREGGGPDRCDKERSGTGFSFLYFIRVSVCVGIFQLQRWLGRHSPSPSLVGWMTARGCW